MVISELNLPERAPLRLTIGDARIAVRNIPGAEHYIPKDAIAPGEIDRGIDTLVEETLQQLDAESMQSLLTNYLAWSDDESQQFFSHPERRPFKSKLDLPSQPSERVGTYLTIGNYLGLRYRGSREKLVNSDVTDPELR